MALTDEQTDYLESLGATDALLNRIRSLVRTYEEVLGAVVEDVFVSEYVSKEAGRIFEGLWVFTRALIGEAQIPEDTGDHLDVVPLHKSVHHMIVEKQAYNMKRAAHNSRLTIEVWFSAQRVGTMRATGRNCDHLWRLTKAYLRPNLVAPIPAG